MKRLLPFLLLLFPATALAVPDPVGPQATATAGTPNGAKSTAELLADLRGGDGSDRLYAARSLKSQLKRALKVEANGRPGTIQVIEARSLLYELESRIPETCTAALEHANVVTPCADMLAWLDAESAIPALEARLREEERKRARKHLAAALAALRAP